MPHSPLQEKGETTAYEDELKALAASDSRIWFSGYVKRYAHLYVILFLWPDTFPIVAFESYFVHYLLRIRGLIKKSINNV